MEAAWLVVIFILVVIVAGPIRSIQKENEEKKQRLSEDKATFDEHVRQGYQCLAKSDIKGAEKCLREARAVFNNFSAIGFDLPYPTTQDAGNRLNELKERVALAGGAPDFNYVEDED